MIGIISYGSGNINAIATIYKKLNIEFEIISKPEDLDNAERLILPGVGAFDATMRQLIDSGFKEKLEELVIIKKRPILGICVGLQVMGNGSEEGNLNGLGWIPGRVKRFNIDKINQVPKLPHMGWNTVSDSRKHPLFDGVDSDFGFYFIHSYYFECDYEENILSTSEYGGEFCSSTHKNNIFGIQFHPEKSHGNGVQLLKNYAKFELC